MLSTGRHNPGNRTLGAGAQRPKKAKRAILAKAPRVDLPASPTRTKKARKAIANLTPIARAPSEPTSKKQAKTRRARLDIHAEDARLSPPSSAHADHGSAVAHNVIVSAAPSPIAPDQAAVVCGPPPPLRAPHTREPRPPIICLPALPPPKPRKIRQCLLGPRPLFGRFCGDWG